MQRPSYRQRTTECDRMEILDLWAQGYDAYRVAELTGFYIDTVAAVITDHQLSLRSRRRER